MANKVKKKPVKTKTKTKTKRRRTRRRTTQNTTDISNLILPKSMQFAEGFIPYIQKLSFQPLPVGTTTGLYSSQVYRPATEVTAIQQQQPTLRDLQQMDNETGPLFESSMEIDIARSTLQDIIDRNPQAFPSLTSRLIRPNNKMLQRFFKQLNKRNSENQLMESDLIQWITENMY